MSPDTSGPVYPVERALGKKVSMRWGYADGHVEVVIRAPWPLPDVTHLLDKDDVREAFTAFNLAHAWAESIRNRRPGNGG